MIWCEIPRFSRFDIPTYSSDCPLVFWHSYGTWPACGWFAYNFNMMLFHSKLLLEGMYYYLSRKVAWWYQVKTCKDYLSVSFSEVAQQSSLDDSLLTFAQAMPVFASLLYSHFQMLIKQLVKNLQYLVKDLDIFFWIISRCLLIPRKIFLFLQLGLDQNLFYKNRNTVQLPW